MPERSEGRPVNEKQRTFMNKRMSRNRKKAQPAECGLSFF
ncbi:hypothetical protein HOLDEFILI_03493 [Holdemania filiformis DSM 12042]|uniref:Uncharacterized protein n=1 Tax=Holdemania filiformis DSM 12042 TaxID=545696 RepID=B9YCD4_9FIRM|nr:hypothetical protein HOLDEFILI_03493 [Holdemania filiformis DSM 12042]